MKSGHKIFHRLAKAGKDQQAAIRAMDNGDLRSLARYLSRPEFANHAGIEQVLGLAIVEGFCRWLHKGEGKLL
jgi:hypothetical protein